MAKTNYIAEWRKHRELSQEKLADAMTEIASTWPPPEDSEPLRWGRTDVNKVENDKRDPRGGFLRAAAAALRCSVADLLERKPTEPLPVREDLRKVAEAWENLDSDTRATALKILQQFPQKRG